MYDLDQKVATREALQKMGFETGKNHLPNLFAVDVRACNRVPESKIGGECAGA